MPLKGSLLANLGMCASTARGYQNLYSKQDFAAVYTNETKIKPVTLTFSFFDGFLNEVHIL